MARSRKQLRGINEASKKQTKAKKAKQKKKSKKLTPEVVRCLVIEETSDIEEIPLPQCIAP